MPYIKQDRRKVLDPIIKWIIKKFYKEYENDLSYLFFDIISCLMLRTELNVQQVYDYNILLKIKHPTYGDINYILTKMSLYYIKKNGVSYATYNTAIGNIGKCKTLFERAKICNSDIEGVTYCCQAELYRRRIENYEDLKILENGDVYYD